MDSASLIQIFGATYVSIFLKAFQQLNVTRGEYVLVLPTSMLQFASDLFVVYSVVQAGLGWNVLVCGVAAGTGAMSSMYIHGRYVKHAHI